MIFSFLSFFHFFHSTYTKCVCVVGGGGGGGSGRAFYAKYLVISYSILYNNEYATLGIPTKFVYYKFH